MGRTCEDMKVTVQFQTYLGGNNDGVEAAQNNIHIRYKS